MPAQCEGSEEDEIPIVLIHGMMATYKDMNILKEEIQKDFPNRRVVSIEILFGYISTLVEMSTRYYRASAISIQKAMINKERCIDIIGHSLGGFVGRAYI